MRRSSEKKLAYRKKRARICLPLSIDSPDPKAIEAGLRKHKGTALINSITLERERAESILSLVKEYGANVIVLLMDEKGMPVTAQDRLRLAEAAMKVAEKHKIYPERLYIDPLVRPISSEPKQALEVLNSVNLIKSRYKVKLICGLSNVSYGLPERSLMNSVFLAMMQNAGLDAAILDPTNKKVKAVLKTSAALLGRDNFCIEYIKSYRSGELTF